MDDRKNNNNNKKTCIQTLSHTHQAAAGRCSHMPEGEEWDEAREDKVKGHRRKKKH